MQLSPGVYTALVTPFHNNGSIDFTSLRKLVERQIEAGVAGLVPCGTTGEAAALSQEEHQKVVAAVVQETAGRCHVIAGAGSNNIGTAIELSKRSIDAGANALLHVTPAYIKPTQQGLIRFFETIADSVEVPIVLYNVPGRTCTAIEPATVLQLAKHERIIALKQATDDLEVTGEVLTQAPESFSVFSGEDSLAMVMIAMGACGVISVASNEFPKLMVELVEASLQGNQQHTLELHRFLSPLMKLNFVQSNPSPVKYVLSRLGLIENNLRIPMTSLESQYEQAVWEAAEQVQNKHFVERA